jgi:dephospho-CoA kinase
MIVLGLTGSIGMGKSTTAGLFAEAGVPVHDSDQAVHRLYAGAAAPLIESAFPGTVRNGVVDRALLSKRLVDDPVSIRLLEGIVHPLVRADADAFVERQRIAGAPLALLDIPLLFETGGTARVDKVAVVSASPQVQRERVLSRPGMTAEKFEALLARQMPDAEKRRRADFVIDTGRGIEPARDQVHAIIRELTGKAPGEPR